MAEWELVIIAIFLVKVILKIVQEKCLLKIKDTYKIKDLNQEKIKGNFYEEDLLQSVLSMSFCAEPDSQIRDQVDVLLDLSNHATGVDASDLAAAKDFVALKAKVDKLDINKLGNLPTSLNNLKAKVNDLDFGILKTVPADLKKLSDVVANEVVKDTKFKTLKTKVNK